MNASLSAALVMLLLAGGWLLGRRRSRPFLRSTDTGSVAALNRAQIERLRNRASAPRPTLAPATPTAPPAGGVTALELAPLPLQPRMRRQRLLQLQAWLTGSREQRLAAMTVVSRSGGRDLLPLLRRALRDPDPAVMAVAAAAIQRYRCGPNAPQPNDRQMLRRRLPLARR